jgi:hypothetical protein
MIIKSRIMVWAGQAARMRGSTKAYKNVIEKPEEKRPLGRPILILENYIKIDLK